MAFPKGWVFHQIVVSRLDEKKIILCDLRVSVVKIIGMRFNFNEDY